MSEPVIQVRGLLSPDLYKGTIDEFFRNPQGYLTVDFANLWYIKPGRLGPFLEAAYKLETIRKNLQFINVCENMHITLMNTNISGKRLISLAEIYTGRTETQIDADLHSIVTNYDKFGVEDREQLLDLIRDREGAYDKAHSGSIADNPWEQELQRRKKEYGLIQCIRLIEENNPEVLNHLGYRYEDAERINRLDKIHDMVAGIKELPKPRQFLVHGERYDGTCKTWIDKKGFGFIAPDIGGKDVFVHRSQAPGYGNWRGLRETNRYSFEAENDSKGWNGIKVEKL